MEGDDDWLVVGDLLAGVSHQNPPSAGLYVSLRVVVTLTQSPLTGLLHGQSPQLTVVLDQPLGHLVGLSLGEVNQAVISLVALNLLSETTKISISLV